MTYWQVPPVLNKLPVRSEVEAALASGQTTPLRRAFGVRANARAQHLATLYTAYWSADDPAARAAAAGHLREERLPIPALL